MNDRTVIGNVDLIGPKVVVGWAIVKVSGISLFPRLLLACNGNVISETSNSVFRNDLQNAHGFGQCGFSIAIPPTTTPEDFAALAVLEEASGEIIGASDARVTMPYGGGIEHRSRSLVAGYVFDTRHRLTLPRVTLGYEGEVVASCESLLSRRDLRDTLDTGQVWHFALQIPTALQPDAEKVSVELDGQPGLFRRVAQDAGFERVSRLASMYFDAAWYRSYPDLAQVDFSAVDALEHFLAIGYYQDLSPTPLFDVRWYTEAVPGLRSAIASGQVVSAFQHYVDHGLASSMDPHPLISHEYIDSTLAGRGHDAGTGIIAAIIDGRVPIGAVNPLVSDAAQRWTEELEAWGRRVATPAMPFRLQSIDYLYFAMVRERAPPSPRYFDAAWYVRRDPSCGLDADDAYGALSHYFRIGRHHGIDPHPLVSTAYFARRQGTACIEATAQGGLLSILLATGPERIGLNPFVPPWSGPDANGRFEFAGEASQASPYIDDTWYFSNNPQARRARELGLIGSATEHLLRARDGEIDDPHPLFAREYYLAVHPDAAAAISGGRSPNAFAYFVEFGQHLGHDPHPGFDSAWYREHWLDLRRAAAADGARAQTAFEYFHSAGRQLNRFPSPYFWAETHAATYSGLPPSATNVARDDSPYSRFIAFMVNWQAASFRPNILFDPGFYAECARDRNIDLKHTKNAFLHYLQAGAQAGLQPNAFFNSTWYARCYLSDEADAAEAFKHYCAVGSRRGHTPNPLFDEDYYLSTHSDVRREIGRGNYINGFAHYCDTGWSENRRTHPSLVLEDAPAPGTKAASGARGSLDRYVTQVKSGLRPRPDLNAVFDEDWYTTTYPEVAGEMEFFNLPSGFAHYIHIGATRLRSPGPLFDEAFYLRTNPDLGAALQNGDLSSGYSHFCNRRHEGRAWHPLLSFDILHSPSAASGGVDLAPSPTRRRMAAAAPSIAATAFTTLAAELGYWTSACGANPANHWAALQLVTCAAQMNERQAVERWLPCARTQTLEPWRALSLSRVERCFSIGDHGVSLARASFAALYGKAEPTFIIERPFPAVIRCGKPTAVTIECVCFHPFYESVEVEICIGHRSIALASDRVVRYDVYEKHRDTDLLGHSLYSGLNDYIVLDDFEPGTTAGVVYRARVQDAFGTSRVFSYGAGDVSFVAPPKAAAAPQSNNTRQRPIAICMATYNPDLELFARQVNSIRLQHYAAWTLFISDDASDPEFVRGMLHEIADDQRVVLQANPMRVGFCKNFERAIELAGPDFEAYALCDQDDEWFCNKLSVLEAALQGDRTLVYSDMEICARDRSTLSESFWTSRFNYWEDINDVLMANSVTGAACLFDRRVLELAMPFPDTSGLYHDHWLALCSLAMGKIDFIPTPLHRYVQHDQNVLGFASSVRSSFALKHFRRRHLEIRRLGRTPAAVLSRAHLGALVNSAAAYREIVRLQATVATIIRRAATVGSGLLDTASLNALWLNGAHFPVAAALTRAQRRGTAGVRKTLGAEFRLSSSMVAHDALQRGRPDVVSRVLSFGVADLRSRLVLEDASLQTLSTKNAHSWRDHLRSKIRPLVLSDDKAAEPPLRVNVLIPELTLSVFFGGYLGKFQLISKLVDHGLAVRVITLDHYVQDAATIAGIEEKYPEFVGLFSRIEIVDRYDRAEAVPVHNRDVFLATTWWSAHVAEAARRHTGKAAFVYLIQEFEPFTFAMGSWYAAAMESYSFPHRALFSTALLQQYFQAEGIGVFDTQAGSGSGSCSFSNAIVDGALYPAPAKIGNAGAGGRRRLLFYARPEVHASRNMFEMGISGLIVALQQRLFPADDWEFIGIGSASADFVLHGGAVLRMIGKMGLDEYYRFLQTVDVGLALMFTPHPSLVPLDMASFGVATVTNTCLNKDEAALRAISPNIVPTPPTIAGIVRALGAAKALALRQPRSERVGRVNWATSWDAALNSAVMAFVLRSLNEIGGEIGCGEPCGPSPVMLPARQARGPRRASRGLSK